MDRETLLYHLVNVQRSLDSALHEVGSALCCFPVMSAPEVCRLNNLRAELDSAKDEVAKLETAKK